jgi:type I restriction enzyme, S subunit
MRTASLSNTQSSKRRTSLGDVTEHWPIVEMGSVLSVCQYGLSVPLRGKGTSAVLRMNNLDDGEVDVSNLKYADISQDLANQFRVLPGDLLFNRTNSIDLVGKVGIFRKEGDFTFASYLIRLRADPLKAYPEFLNHYLNWPKSQRRLKEIATQAASQANINATNLRSFSMPLPSLPEQIKIADILSTVDAAVRKTGEILSECERLRVALMQRLLRRGLGHSTFRKTDFGGLPKSWAIRTLEEVGEWFSGGTPSKANKDLWAGSIPWVSPKDMKSPRLSDSIDHVSEGAIGNGTRLIPANSLLVVVRGMILAHTFPVALTQKAMAFNQDIKACVTGSGFDPEFVLYWLKVQENRVLALASGSAHGTKRLASEDLFKLPVPQPPRQEQSNIVAILRTCDEQIEISRMRRKAALSLKHGLMQQLLSGKLLVKV